MVTSPLYLGTADGLRVAERDSAGCLALSAGQTLDNAPVTAIRPDPDGSGALLCAVGVWGIWRVTPDGRSAEPRHTGIENRELHALAVSSDGATLFAGAAPPDLYRSDDGGATWQTVEGFRTLASASNWFYPVPPLYPNIRQIVAHPTEPKTLFVGVEVGGLFRSRDGGASWDDLTGDLDPDCHAVALHPARPDRILAATPKGVYKSDDGGATWANFWEGRAPTYSASIAVAPDAPDLVIAGISKGFRGGDTALHFTEDGGRTWRVAEGDVSRLAPSQIRGALGYSRSEPRRAYAGTLAGDLFESEDGGRSWRLALSGLPSIRSLYAP